MSQSFFDREGRVPKPFEAVLVDAKTKEEAEMKFRENHSETEAQIDEIRVNKFCAMVIYHDPKIALLYLKEVLSISPSPLMPKMVPT